MHAICENKYTQNINGEVRENIKGWCSKDLNCDQNYGTFLVHKHDWFRNYLKKHICDDYWRVLWISITEMHIIISYIPFHILIKIWAKRILGTKKMKNFCNIFFQKFAYSNRLVGLKFSDKFGSLFHVHKLFSLNYLQKLIFDWVCYYF